MKKTKSVFSVGQINTYIKNMFRQDYLLHTVLVRGEVSNCKYHSSGHIYFTLKDETGSLSCVMFAGNRRGLTFHMKEGDQVIAAGSVDVYPRDGRYQLYAEQIIADGAGVLNERYEQLKHRLEELGMFDESYKQPIPRYIQTLGVVTAPTGAAVRDIINVSLRRNPYLQIILYPALVQGEGAAQSIVNGIRALEMQKVDVIIIGRGGGSLEDLWAFNEEIVAQAVFDCTVPIISAVGHETDTVITDYVADLRAPTPSAAAELAVFDYFRLVDTLEEYRSQLTGSMEHRIALRREQLASLERALGYASPAAKVRERRMQTLQLTEQLNHAMEQCLTAKKHELALLAGRLHAASPLVRLSGGYGYVEKDGRGLRSIQEVQKGDLLQIYLQDGSFMAKAEEILPTTPQTSCGIKR